MDKEKIEITQITNRIPFRKKATTDIQYIEQLIDAINGLDKQLAALHEEYLQVVNKENVLPKAYCDNLIKRYHKLIDELRKNGLYVGQEL